MKTGIELIAQERKEQIKKHNFDAKHDAQHTKNQLLQFAIYCMTGIKEYFPYDWSNVCGNKIFKKNRVDQLVIAGACIAAEIDRIQRKPEPEFEGLNQKK